VLGTFRRPFMGRPVPRQLLRNELLDLATIVPATTYHRRSYAERYSGFRYAAIISKILDERLNGEILIHKHFGVKCHEITSLLALVSTYGVFQKTFWSLLNNTSDDAGRLSSFPVDGYSKFVLPRIAFVPFGSVSSIVESPCPFKSKCAELVCSSPRAQSRI